MHAHTANNDARRKSNALDSLLKRTLRNVTKNCAKTS
jgi:hypothetical protein